VELAESAEVWDEILNHMWENHMNECWARSNGLDPQASDEALPILRQFQKESAEYLETTEEDRAWLSQIGIDATPTG
jgi:hypothetical protein